MTLLQPMPDNLKERYSHFRAIINSHPLSDYINLLPSKGKLMFCCPICGSGTKSNRTGALRLYEPTAKHPQWRVVCFSGHCFGDRGTDTIGAIRLLHPEMSEWEVFKYCKINTSPVHEKRPELRVVSSVPPSSATFPTKADPFPFDVWFKALSGSEGEEYLKRRGFTGDTIANYRLGYIKNHYFPSLLEKDDAIVIPYPDENYWVARAIHNKAFDKPRAGLCGPEPLFNKKVLWQNHEAIFVVESQLCALSLSQLGFPAVALGNSGGSRLIAALSEASTHSVIILSLDNDPQDNSGELTKGPRAQKKLYDDICALNIPVIEYNISGSEKDPNDLLQKDPEALKSNIVSAISLAVHSFDSPDTAADDAALSEKEQYLKENVYNCFDSFYAEIKRRHSNPPIKTGFSALDQSLEGGLVPGLYTIGALTSLGKTSFILQMCDQIASSGQDVLFFSLEMSRFELMAKSIARLTCMHTEGIELSQGTKRTTLEILGGHFRADTHSAEQKAIITAESEYRKFTNHLWILEGDGTTTVTAIRDHVQRHIKFTGNIPVIVIDYIQILSSVDNRYSDKQNTDHNVLALKRLSRDLSAVIIVISSLNRDNYFLPINLSAYKETGAIEYGSDCLMGLQYEGMDYREGENEKAREKRIRELSRANELKAKMGEGIMIELKVLKNRNGAKGYAIPYRYTPKYNYFEEQSKAPGSLVPHDPFNGAKCVPLRK